MLFCRGHGEVVLPEVHGRLHTKVLQTPPHRRGLFRHRLSPHALHGAPGVPAEETRQPIRSQALRVQDSPPGLSGVIAYSGNEHETTLSGTKLKWVRGQTLANRTRPGPSFQL